MKRRLFLSFPLLLPSLAGNTKIPRAGNGFKVPAGKDRYDNDLHYLGARLDCKVSSKDSEGDQCIYELSTTEKSGPPFHIHYSQDEWFYVIRGEFMFKIGHEMFYLKPGDSAFGPRKMPHSYTKTSNGDAQLLMCYQPAGSIELFFREASRLQHSSDQDMQPIFRKHGMDILGPPLRNGEV